MKTIIYARIEKKDLLSFYIIHEGEKYYLFGQRFSGGIYDYYKGGVSLNDAIDHTKGRCSKVIDRVMEKLPSYIRYIEREYGLCIMEKTKKYDHCRGRNKKYALTEEKLQKWTCRSLEAA